jgi:dihydrofolate reductase
MRKLTAFNFVTLDGYYKGLEEDISWHNHGIEETRYSEEMLSLGNILLFGRKTYEQMAYFWTSEMAKEIFPKVVEGMNNSEKIVFSTQAEPDEIWVNTRFISGNIAESINHLKQTPGKDLTILGSGSIVAQFAGQNLIDEYKLMIDPVVLGQGVPLFEGIKQNLNLKLIGVRTFSGDSVLIEYKSD